MAQMNPTPFSTRKELRLPEYDYTNPGGYFLTMCVIEMKCLFGSVIENAMKLNRWGEIVRECWEELPNHYPQITLDEFVVMPNHFHAILHIHDMRFQKHTLQNVGEGLRPSRIEPIDDAVGEGLRPSQSCRAGLRPAPTQSVSLTEIVRAFKSFSSREINKIRNTPGTHIWQRNYYEHIIRNETDYHNIQSYIRNNPQQWTLDKYYR